MKRLILFCLIMAITGILFAEVTVTKYEVLKDGFIRATNSDGSISTIPANINNADYRKYLGVSATKTDIDKTKEMLKELNPTVYSKYFPTVVSDIGGVVTGKTIIK